MPQAISLLLGVLAGFARNRNEWQLAEFLDLADELVKRGDAARTELEELAEEIRILVESGEGPSEEQRAAVRNRRAELSAEIQALDGGD